METDALQINSESNTEPTTDILEGVNLSIEGESETTDFNNLSLEEEETYFQKSVSDGYLINEDILVGVNLSIEGVSETTDFNNLTLEEEETYFQNIEKSVSDSYLISEDILEGVNLSIKGESETTDFNNLTLEEEEAYFQNIEKSVSDGYLISEKISKSLEDINLWGLEKTENEAATLDYLQDMSNELLKEDFEDFNIFIRYVRLRLKKERYDNIKKLKSRIKEGLPVGSALDFFSDRSKKESTAATELRSSKEFQIGYLKLNDINQGEKELKKFLKWAKRKYKYKIKCRKKRIRFCVNRNKMDEFKDKFNIQLSNRIFTEIKDLPKVQDNIFLLTPHASTEPIDCFEKFPSGAIYLGTANALGMNGYGTYMFPNGAIYVGQIKDNRFHGFGRIIYPNKTLVEGLWYNGKIINPKLTFSDGLHFQPENWNYLSFPDRRFMTERIRGMLPDTNPQLSNDHPARTIPSECFDNGEGFYHYPTKTLYDAKTGMPIRIPSVNEANWIVRNCRYSSDFFPVPFIESMYPAQYGKIGYKTYIGLDEKWYKQKFPQYSKNELKKMKQDIIKYFDGGKQLSFEEILDLAVKPMQDVKPAEIYYVHKKQSANVNNLTISMKKLLYPEIYESPSYLQEREKLMEYFKIKQGKKFRIKRFIRTLNKIRKFISGKKELEWSKDLEYLIKDYLKSLRKLKDGFINQKINLEMFGGCKGKDEDKIEKALLKYSYIEKNEDLTKQDSSDIDYMESFQLKTEKAKALEIPIENMSTSSSQNFPIKGSEFYSKKLRKKLREGSSFIKTYSKKRN